MFLKNETTSIKKVYEMMNMNVYHNNQSLYIQFDIIYQPEEDDIFDGPSYLEDLEQAARQYIMEPELSREYGSIIPPKNIVYHLLSMQKASSSKNNLVESMPAPAKPFTTLQHKKIIYEASSIPHQMINWMACFGLILEKKGGYLPLHKQFASHESFDNMEQPIAQCQSIPTIMKGIMERLIAYKSNSGLCHYHRALDDLEKLYHAIFSIKAPNMAYYHKPFMEFFSDAYRCEMLYKDQHTATINKTPEENDIILLKIAATMIAEKAEFLFMTDLLNTKHRIDFIDRCLHHKTASGDLFTWDYTELLLIYFSEFRLFQNSCMGIINLDKNPVYKEFYQQGGEFYTLFHKEIQHLFGCLGLKLQPDQDFHQQKTIFFHQDCTPALMKMNLHLNSQYCKNLFQTYLVCKYFKRYSLANNNGFSKLPEKILHKIILEVHPSLKAIYHNSSNTGFFHAARLGEKGAVSEYGEDPETRLQLLP